MSTSLNSLFQGVGDFLGGVSDFAKDALGSVGGIVKQYKDIFEPESFVYDEKDDSQDQIRAALAANNQNLSLSDFAFKPNYSLLIGGGLLLIVALVLLRK